MEHDELGAAVHQVSHLVGRFTLRSGQVADEYFDKFRFTGHPALLAAIVDEMAQLVPPDADALAGLEMGGVPLAAALALRTGLPAIYVRKARKAYGTQKIAEGGDIAGKRLVVVEDVVSTAGQVVLSTADLRAEDAVVTTALTVIDREMGGPGALATIGVELRPVFTMSELARLGAGAHPSTP